MSITKTEIEKYNQSGAKLLVSINDLKSIYKDFDRPKVKAVIDNNKAFLTLQTAPNVQFIIEKLDSESTLQFIEDIVIVNLDKNKQGVFLFILKEFWQGRNVPRKILHFIYTSGVMVFFNYLVLEYSSEKNILNSFTGILTAVSIFIAVFSVFVANHDQMSASEKSLFKTGKFSYYTSVDKNVNLLGIMCIALTLFGLLITGDSDAIYFGGKWFNNVQEFLTKKTGTFFLLNISFLFAFLTLRTLIEFYVIRPGKFLIGRLKDDFLKSFDE